MRTDERIEYHSDRAEAELQLGLLAKGQTASRAHLELASLHMQRVRELSGNGAHAGPAR